MQYFKKSICLFLCKVNQIKLLVNCQFQERPKSPASHQILAEERNKSIKFRILLRVLSIGIITVLKVKYPFSETFAKHNDRIYLRISWTTTRIDFL